MTNLHPTRSNPNNIQPLFQPRILVVVKIILTLCFNLLTSFQHTREQFHKFGLRKHYWDDNTAECICATITYFGTCACWKPLRHGPEVITHFIYDEVKIYSYKKVRYYKAYCIMSNNEQTQPVAVSLDCMGNRQSAIPNLLALITHFNNLL